MPKSLTEKVSAKFLQSCRNLSERVKRLCSHFSDTSYFLYHYYLQGEQCEEITETLVNERRAKLKNNLSKFLARKEHAEEIFDDFFDYIDMPLLELEKEIERYFKLMRRRRDGLGMESALNELYALARIRNNSRKPEAYIHARDYLVSY